MRILIAICLLLTLEGCGIWRSPVTKGILWDDCERYTFSNIRIVPNHKETKK